MQTASNFKESFSKDKRRGIRFYMSNIEEVNKEQREDLNAYSNGSDKVQAPTENVINRIRLIDILEGNDYVNNNIKIFHKNY